MSEKDKYREEMKDKLRRYYNGSMSDKERNTFERSLERDPFEADAMEGLSSISHEEMEEDLKKLESRLVKRTTRRKPAYYRIAAAVIVLVGISSIILVRQLNEPDIMVSENMSPQKETTGSEEPDKANEIISDIYEFESASDFPEKSSEKRALEVEITNVTDEQEEILSYADAVDEKTEIEVVSEDNVPITGGVRSKQALPLGARKKESKGILDEPETTISGVVLAAEDNLPLPGVSIAIRGSSRGVTSDIDGSFTIDANRDDTLIASYIGMKNKEVEVSKADNNRIIMDADKMSIDEVVVVAYGLEGKAAGVEVISAEKIDMEDEFLPNVNPIPEGGMKAFRDYIDNNQLFPESWTDTDREVVRIKFLVRLDGKPSDLEIIRSPSSEFSKEAKRLITEGPLWSPATADDVPYEGTVRLRIVFRR